MKSVLVLEDDRAVRDLLTALLRDSGYLVVTAGAAQETIDLMNDKEFRIDLLIADVVLPQGSGLHVAIDLLQNRPDLEILFISGYPLEVWASRFADDVARLPSSSVNFLQKPFRPSELLTRVEQLIGQVC